MIRIISGIDLSSQIKNNLKEKIALLDKKPCLAVIIVGKDAASQIYVKNKEKSCKVCGIKSLKYELPEETSEYELLSLIEKINNDDEINGLLVQLPLPKHIDEKKIIMAINPKKDVDCFHPINVGNLYTGNITEKSMLPCTPKGCIHLIKNIYPLLEGKKVCVIGRSNIVGKPVAQLFLNENCTTKITHSRTENLVDETKWADILVVAMGRAKFVNADMVKEGAVVIDVGMNRVNGELCGDVDFDSVKNKVSAITPVPGGVGPMTIACLMENVYNTIL
ncbi:MAG: bifunctional methylenetetrahydrofolate dehydrogenase/methenyltetrahydrofolate cyclohydrolase [Rickettsiales bacterium]|jgi:methylenetetrahydrofolate dehydrogenase (NADP+)/methenyltetrahydrofolate cyclohydrolase|nr:bifunctional methylenetetrahydrofolate dehydrogenase/methenyltetrahydrofolate cyclohydrolase [Rickettsiales bacterium]